jgi:hypothetical protein
VGRARPPVGPAPPPGRGRRTGRHRPDQPRARLGHPSKRPTARWSPPGFAP